MFERVAEFLFKYRPVLFQEGEVRFATTGWFWIVLVGLVVTGLSAWTYRMARGRTTGRDRLLLTGLRASVLALLLFAILKPTLVLTRVIPERNFVGILVDDSRSMTVEDQDGLSRAEVALAQIGDDEASLRSRLDERFGVRVFRFSEVASRIDSLAQLSFAGRRTDLAAALDFVRDELAGVPLSGLVVLRRWRGQRGSPPTGCAPAPQGREHPGVHRGHRRGRGRAGRAGHQGRDSSLCA